MRSCTQLLTLFSILPLLLETLRVTEIGLDPFTARRYRRTDFTTFFRSHAPFFYRTMTNNQ